MFDSIYPPLWARIIINRIQSVKKDMLRVPLGNCCCFVYKDKNLACFELNECLVMNVLAMLRCCGTDHG